MSEHLTNPEERLDPATAMAVYSGDGQVDDATGGDAAAELLRTRMDEDRTEPGPPSPDTGMLGPS